MVTTVAIGCWFGLLRIAPHIAVLILGVFVGMLSLFLIIRLRRRKFSLISHVAVYTFAVMAWLYLYVVSIGPVVAFHQSVLGLNDDALEFVYAPVIWLHDATPLDEPLEEYGALWGWH